MYSQVLLGKEMEKRRHLRHDWKTPIEGAEVTQFGKLFHIGAETTRKARSLALDCRVWPTISSQCHCTDG